MKFLDMLYSKILLIQLEGTMMAVWKEYNMDTKRGIRIKFHIKGAYLMTQNKMV
jgi:hypothetical protein